MLKRIFGGFVKVFLVLSGLLVAGIAGLLFYIVIFYKDPDTGKGFSDIYAEERKLVDKKDKQKGKKEKPPEIVEEEKEPLYERYEDVGEFREIVIDAIEDGEYDGIKIHISSADFFENVVIALEMMKEEAPSEYEYVKEETEAIVESKRSYARGKITYLKFYGVAHSVLQTATTIMHEAVHHHQPPGMDFTKAELEAHQGEVRLLEALDAPERMIDHTKSLKGRHWDNNNDNARTLEDFLMHLD